MPKSLHHDQVQPFYLGHIHQSGRSLPFLSLPLRCRRTGLARTFRCVRVVGRPDRDPFSYRTSGTGEEGDIGDTALVFWGIDAYSHSRMLLFEHTSLRDFCLILVDEISLPFFSSELFLHFFWTPRSTITLCARPDPSSSPRKRPSLVEFGVEVLVIHWSHPIATTWYDEMVEDVAKYPLGRLR